MITFEEYLNERVFKGLKADLTKETKPLTIEELKNIINNRDTQALASANTSEITSFKDLFKGSDFGSEDFNPDISNWDISKVKNMWGCFRGCANLKKAPVWDTKLVENMWAMFSGCTNLEECPPYNTQFVENMWGMFRGCINIKKAPNYNTQFVNNMSNMFKNCKNLLEGDMSDWDTSNVHTKSDMFVECPFPKSKQPKFKD